MTEFNPNCGKCGMLNSRGFCALTACRYPSNAIVVEPKVIRGMMVNPQIEKPQTHYDRIISKTPYELAEWIAKILDHCENKMPDEMCRQSCPLYKCCNDQPYDNIEEWLKSPVEVDE